MTKGEKWTIDEEQFLRANWGSVTVRDIAAHLGRTNLAIISRAARLGLLPSLTQSPESDANHSSDSSITRKDKGLANSNAKKRGDQFEEYVKRMFPGPDFRIMLASEGRGSKVPDFYIKYAPQGYKFWVEARYRQGTDDGGLVNIFGDRPDRLNLLHAFQAIVLPESVFVILGLGGSPDYPRDLFRIPVKDVRYASLKIDHLKVDWRCGRSFSKYVDYMLV